MCAEFAYHTGTFCGHIDFFHFGVWVVRVAGFHYLVCSTLHILDVMVLHVLRMLIVHLVCGFTLISTNVIVVVVIVPLVVQMCVHVLDVFSRVQLSGRHRESLLVEKCNDPLLAQHQLNHSFSFVLIEICVIFESCHTWLCDAGRCVGCLGRIDEIDSDTKARLRRIDLHLGVLLVLLPL